MLSFGAVKPSDVRKISPKDAGLTPVNSGVAVRPRFTQEPSTCPNGIALPPAPPQLADVPPFLQVSVDQWKADADADRALTFKLNYDARQLSSALTGAVQVELLNMLGPSHSDDVADWALAATKNYAVIVPHLAQLGIPADAAPAIARFVVAREAFFRAYAKLSDYYFNASQASRSGGPQALPTYYTNAAGKSIKITNADFVQSYRGLKRESGKWLFIPLIEGQVMMWAVEPPFLDGGHKWGLYVTWVDGQTFKLNLTRMPKGVVSMVAGLIKSVLRFACNLVTMDKMQDVRNYATLVPEPHVQTVLAGWQVAAAACGIAFPVQPTETPVDPCAVPPSEETFWQKYGTKLLVGGGVLLAAAVGLKVYRQRQRA